MKMPNAEKAIIAPEKLRDYLLNPTHRRGGTKARLLLSFGYRTEDWPRLEKDLREQHLTGNVEKTTQTDYGMRYNITVPMLTPDGRTLRLRSIWQIDTGTEVPRLITIVPE